MSGCRRPCRRGDGANGSSWEQLSARARTQAGFSLTESLATILLVTLVIMGIAALSVAVMVWRMNVIWTTPAL